MLSRLWSLSETAVSVGGAGCVRMVGCYLPAACEGMSDATFVHYFGFRLCKRLLTIK